MHNASVSESKSRLVISEWCNRGVCVVKIPSMIDKISVRLSDDCTDKHESEGWTHEPAEENDGWEDGRGGDR